MKKERKKLKLVKMKCEIPAEIVLMFTPIFASVSKPGWSRLSHPSTSTYDFAKASRKTMSYFSKIHPTAIAENTTGESAVEVPPQSEVRESFLSWFGPLFITIRVL